MGLPERFRSGWGAEMLDFVAAARRQFKGDYYQGLLADMLEEDLKKRP